MFISFMAKLNNNQLINNLQDNFLKKNLPNIKIGDNVKIGVKIIEGNRERIQFYEGVVIEKK
jgi:large subunit ribosomal protein L19